MISLLGFMFAGLGLFFFGATLLDRHLRALTGRRLREVFAGLLDNEHKAGWMGFWIGAITQTASAVTYLTISMVNTGLLRTSRAFSALNWSNPGTCVLIFFLTLPLDIFTAYVLGLAGVLYAFQRPKGMRHIVGFIFGMGLLFYGLLLMQEHGGELREFAWFERLMSAAAGQYTAVFLVGVALTIVAQSGNAVVLLVIVLAQANLLAEDEAVIAIFGVNLGASIITQLLTLQLKGVSKQMAMFQVYYGWVGTFVFVPLFFIEIWTGVPLVLAGLKASGLPLAQQLAVANLLWCLGASLAIMPLQGWMADWMARKYPSDDSENDDRPRYLYPKCEEDPASCLFLIRKEHQLLAKRLTRYFNLAEGPDSQAFADAEHAKFHTVADEVGHVLHAIMDRPQRSDATATLARAMERHDLLCALEREFYQVLPKARRQSSGVDSLAHRTLEGLEAAWLTVLDAFLSGEAEDLELAKQVTADGGGALSRLRENFLDPASGANREQQAVALHLLGGCERLIWLANRLLTSINEPGMANVDDKA
ncbi:MAG: Na/Pi symporter [Puniceicoccales bacterium]